MMTSQIDPIHIIDHGAVSKHSKGEIAERRRRDLQRREVRLSNCEAIDREQ